MFRRERNGGADRLEPFRHVLLGQPHHEIETNVLESGCAGLENRRPGAVGRVQPREAPEFRLPKGLDTETEAIDSAGAKSGEPRLVDAFGIDLQGDFGVAGDIEGRPAGGHDAGDFAWFEQ